VKHASSAAVVCATLAAASTARAEDTWTAPFMAFQIEGTVLASRDEARELDSEFEWFRGTFEPGTCAVGGAYRVTLQSPYALRGGIAFAFYHFVDATAVIEPLPEGITLKDPVYVDGELELFAGASYDAEVAMPYADLAVTFQGALVQAKTDVAGVGPAGYSSALAGAVGLAPRVGILVPFNDFFYFDGALQYGLLGMTGVGGHVAFGWRVLL
jgi:hypothetical protein